nr:translation initiation factor IF-2-like [Manis javanica]
MEDASDHSFCKVAIFRLGSRNPRPGGAGAAGVRARPASQPGVRIAAEFEASSENAGRLRSRSRPGLGGAKMLGAPRRGRGEPRAPRGPPIPAGGVRVPTAGRAAAQGGDATSRAAAGTTAGGARPPAPPPPRASCSGRPMSPATLPRPSRPPAKSEKEIRRQQAVLLKHQYDPYRNRKS